MASFDEAYEKTMVNEGGYIFDPDDAGGETYKGVARRYHAKWSGWQIIDSLKNEQDFKEKLDKNSALQDAVKMFYKQEFWRPIKADKINSQRIGETIFDFGVNAGVKTSIRLAQQVSGSTADGISGPNTLRALNNFDEAAFLNAFAIAKIERYVELCEKRSTNRKFFYGWVRRTLESV